MTSGGKGGDTVHCRGELPSGNLDNSSMGSNEIGAQAMMPHRREVLSGVQERSWEKSTAGVIAAYVMV